MKKIVILVALLSFFSCRKEKNGTTRQPDALTEEEVKLLDAIPEATGFNKNTVLLPNGEILGTYMQAVDSAFYNKWLKKTTANLYDMLGPQDARNYLIACLASIALNLSDRSNYQIPNEGVDKPYQNGLAYSWGQKQFLKNGAYYRAVAPGANAVCNDKKLCGLDCSGFIYQLFYNSQVPIPEGPSNLQRQASTIQNAIASAIPTLKKVKVEEFPELPSTKIQAGDIIYWTQDGVAFHIGIALESTDGTLAVFSSNGSPKMSCAENMNLKHGPVRKTINSNIKNWFGKDKGITYGVTRINSDISGNWEFKFRCSSSTVNFGTLELKFPSSEASSFKLSQSYLDLDGSTNNVDFNFSYDNTTNVLSCIFITTDNFIPGFERKDHFSIKLTRDLIENISAEQDYVHNGVGCIYAVSVKNMN